MPDDYHWINMVREPVEKDSSWYYFAVSESRAQGAAIQERKHRDKDVSCGCPYLEYDHCMRHRIENNCSLSFFAPSISYFSSVVPQGNRTYTANTPHVAPNLNGFTGDDAFNRVKNEYVFVGITEEFELSIKALEILEPRFFRGASELSAKHKSSERKNETPKDNKVTHTSMSGAVSDTVRKALSEANHEDIILYEKAKRHFWYTISHLLPEEVFYSN